MSYEPMTRRLVATFTLIGVLLSIGGLIARPSNITVAVILFLLALGMFSLAGYGLLDLLVDRQKRTRRTT
jgi:hypothetical protein